MYSDRTQLITSTLNASVDSHDPVITDHTRRSALFLCSAFHSAVGTRATPHIAGNVNDSTQRVHPCCPTPTPRGVLHRGFAYNGAERVCTRHGLRTTFRGSPCITTVHTYPARAVLEGHGARRGVEQETFSYTTQARKASMQQHSNETQTCALNHQTNSGNNDKKPFTQRHFHMNLFLKHIVRINTKHNMWKNANSNFKQ